MQDDYLGDTGEILDYLALADLSRHLIDLMLAGKLEEFPAVFAVVEELHVQGDAYVRNAATIGLQESLQNLAEQRNVSKDDITQWLQPESRKWWDRLEAFWSGDHVALGKAP